MTTKGADQEKQATGFLGRFLGRGEAKPKYKRANLGENNQLYYDQERKIWRKAGEEGSDVNSGPPPPPPVSGSGFRPSTASHTSQSRYADAGGFGKSAAAPAGNSNLLPRPVSAPQSVPFLPQPQQPASGGVPKFFQPGGTQKVTPVWGSNKTSLPPVAASPTAQAPQPDVPGPSQAPAQTSFTSHNDTNDSARSSHRDDTFSWSAWRQQDEERRHRERQNASQLGADVMESFKEDAAPDSSAMPATTSFTDLEDPGLQNTSTSQPSWHTGQTGREAANRSIQPGTPPARNDIWAGGQVHSLDQASAEPASPSEAPDSIINAQNFEKGSQGVPTSTGDNFFGEGPQQADTHGPADGFGDGNHEAAMGEGEAAGYGNDWAAGAGQEYGFEASAEGLEGAQQQDAGLQFEGEQTFGGGYTHQQLLDWAAYYVGDSQFTEEEAQNWVEACLAQPDPPGLVAETGEQQEAAQAEQPDYTQEANAETSTPEVSGAEGEPMVPQQGQDEIDTALQGHTTELSVNGNPPGSNSFDSGSPRPRLEGGDGGTISEQLQQMLEAKKAENPNFPKLTGPLPWDGVISDQDETPPGSPRGFLRANSRRASPSLDRSPVKKQKNDTASELPAVKLEKDTADSGLPETQNRLGATWLDDFSKKMSTTQWFEPGQYKAGRAGSRQLFGRRPSEATSQKSLPPPEIAEHLKQRSKPATPQAGQQDKASTPASGVEQPPAGQQELHEGLNGHADVGTEHEAHPQANFADENGWDAEDEFGILDSANNEASLYNAQVQQLEASPHAEFDTSQDNLPQETAGSAAEHYSNSFSKDPTTEEDEIAKLRQQLQRSEQACQDLSQKLEALTSDHEALMSDAQEGLEDREQLSREVQALQDRCTELEGAKRSMEESLKDAKKVAKEQADLRIKRQELLERYEAMQHKHKTMMQEHTDLQAKYQAAQEPSPDTVKAAEEVNALKTRLRQLEEESAEHRQQLTSEAKKLQKALQETEAVKAEALSKAEELEEQLASAADEKEGWQDRLETLEEDRAKLKADLAAAQNTEQKLAAEQGEKAALQNELASLKQKLQAEAERVESASRSDQQRLREQVKKLEAEAAGLREALAAASASSHETAASHQEKVDLRSKLQAAEAECQAWQAKHKAVRAKASAALAKQRKEGEDKIHALEQEADAVRKKLLEAQQDSSLAQAQQQEHDKAQQELALREEECKSLAQDLDTAQQAHEELQQQLEQAKASESASEARHAETAETCRSFKRKVEELNASRDELMRMEEETKQKLNDLEAENEELFQKATTAEEEADGEKGKLHAAQTELAEAKARMEALQEERSKENGSMLQQMGEEVTSLRAELSQREEAYTILQAERNGWKAQLQEALSSVQQAEQKLESAETENASLISAKDAEIKQLTEQLSEARQQLQKTAESQAQADIPASAPQSLSNKQEDINELKAQLEKEREDMSELLACLGQEGDKLSALEDMLVQQGTDRDSINAVLAKIEAKWGSDSDGAPEGSAQEVPSPSAAGGADLSFMNQPLDDAEGDWSFS